MPSLVSVTSHGFLALSAALGAVAIGASGSVTRAQTPVPAGFADSIVLSGLQSPTAVAFAPDGRVFVGEKSGLVKVFDSLSDPSPSVFADLRTQVFNYLDRGMLGLAVDPAFPARPYVYVLYTRDAPIGGVAPQWGTPGATSDFCPDPPGMDDGCVASGRLSRLEAVGNVWSGTEHVLIDDWFQQFDSHSLGSLAFGADGALYASGGDAASWQFVDYGQAGDPPNPNGDPPVPPGGTQTPPTAEGGALRSQDLRTEGDPVGLNGTVIRIDPDTGAAMPDNPLSGHPDPNAKRILAYGLRNPFRITVRPGTREVWVGDVGWRIYEEIDVIPDPASGVVPNFGWPCYDGATRQVGYDAADLDMCERLYAESNAVTFAHFQYSEGTKVVSGESCGSTDSATTGLAFYEGGSYPVEYDGALFFADYARKCIWVMPADSNGVPDPSRRATFIAGAANPVDLKIGPGGDLFYVDITGGTIRRIRYTAGNQPPVARVAASPTSGQAPLTVAFDAGGSTDPEGGALVYSWDLNGDGTYGDSALQNPSYTYGANGTYSVSVRVTDDGGLQDVAATTIVVGNTAPTAVIDSPPATLLWRVGQSYTFSGHATDQEDGALPASRLTWSLILNHCSTSTSCHEHFVQEYSGVASGTFTGADHDYPSYLTLELTATDGGGLQHTVSRRLDPQAVVLTFQTNPSGLEVTVGGTTYRTPTSRTVIVGSSNTVSGPSPQTLSGSTYAFASWSDGGAQTHIVEAPGTALTLTATYTAVASTLPPGWSAQDIGAVGPAGSSSHAAGTYTVKGAGADVWGTADAFHFAYQSMSGDGAIVARVASVQGAHAWTKVGVMIRESTGASSAHAFMLVSSSKGLAFQRRNATGAVSTSTSLGTGSAPEWVKLARSGDVLTASYSPDGVAWTALGSETIPMAATVLAGLAVTSHDATQLATGAFDNVTVTGVATPGSGEVVLYAAKAPVKSGAWRVVTDSTAAGGSRISHPDAGAPRVTQALASPANYFDMTFQAQAGTAYRVWIRGKADANHWANDSVFVQFSGAVTSAGSPQWRIGTTAATEVNLEDCSGCGLSGWGWQDNAYPSGAAAPLVYFAAAGTQTVRIQTREDGLSIDQIVLSPAAFLSASPGALKADTTILPEQQGGGSPPPSGEIVEYAAEAIVRSGNWVVVTDSNAAGGARLRNPDAGTPKLTTALAAPANYFEVAFDAEAGKAYRLWIRLKADNNHWGNDSVFVQFSGSVTSEGTPQWRIGTSSAAEVNLEDCVSCGISGWGWQDNGYGAGVLGPLVYFSTTGRQTLRVQPREDGASIDQIVLSSRTYLSASPGALKNDTTILPKQ